AGLYARPLLGQTDRAPDGPAGPALSRMEESRVGVAVLHAHGTDRCVVLGDGLGGDGCGAVWAVAVLAKAVVCYRKRYPTLPLQRARSALAGPPGSSG